MTGKAKKKEKERYTKQISTKKEGKGCELHI